MSATVVIQRLTGAGPSATTVSGNTRCNLADAAYTNETTNPLIKPASGTSYSWYGVLQLNCTANASGHTLNNLKVYSGGVNDLGTGRDLLVKASSSYTQASSASALAGTSSFFGYTSGAPLTLTGSTSSTGLFGQMLYIQHSITSSVLLGAGTATTITFQYDESL